MKWLHNLLKGASLTGALFVFQACYGIPQGPLHEPAGQAPMNFKLISHDTGLPVEGIRILVNDYGTFQLLGQTDAEGRCHVEIPYVRNEKGPFLTFEDPQGFFQPKDTTLADLRERDIIVKLENFQ